MPRMNVIGNTIPRNAGGGVRPTRPRRTLGAAANAHARTLAAADHDQKQLN